MALEHALLVALREHPSSGLDLAKRFSRSIGYFWSATHQQIYRVLSRMESDGWVSVEAVAQTGRPDKKVYDVTATGRRVLAGWLAEPAAAAPLRSDLAVKMRGASFGERSDVLAVVEAELAEHRLRLDVYEQLMTREHPAPEQLEGRDLDQHLVLRGGILMEQTWITWLNEYLEAHR
ncbi:MAG: PadR family transcriptional regulator [Nocardioides sp.]|nr:PadR family transcriptional regulator [Nocardioides sp.]